MILVDGMIRTGRFKEFVDETVRIHNTELEDETMWEFWLHRIFDKTFSEFRSEAEASKNETVPNVPTQEAIKKTINESMGILNDFRPS